MSTGSVDQTGVVRACLFLLAGETFAVDVRWVREVVVLEDYTVVPRAPSYLIGVANLRGRILPILDIRPLLEVPLRRIGRGTKALVIEAASLQVAVAIDEALELRSFDEIMPAGAEAPRECGPFAMGLLTRGDGLVTLLDAPKLLETLRIRAPGSGAATGGR